MMRSKNRSGMTLIELIMIIAIGSALVAGIVRFTQQQITNGTQMRDYLVALNLARLKMAIANNTAYASLAAGTLSAEASFPGFISQMRLGAPVTSGVYNIREVDIDVDYVGGTYANKLASLTTYREDHITIGDGI